MKLIKRFPVKKNRYYDVAVFSHNDLTIIAATAARSTKTYIHIAPARTSVRAYQGAYYLSDICDVSSFIAIVQIDVPRNLRNCARIDCIAPFEQEGWVSQDYIFANPIPLNGHELTCSAMQSMLDSAFECPHTFNAIRADIQRRIDAVTEKQKCANDKRNALQNDIEKKRAEYARTMNTDPVFIKYGIGRVYSPNDPDAIPFTAGDAVIVLHPQSGSAPTVYSSPAEFITRHNLDQ